MQRIMSVRKVIGALEPVCGASATERRGFNYIALGDTHGYRELGTSEHRMLYPGTPEPTRFGEMEAGHVALVFFPRADRDPLIHRMRVGHWTWRDESCNSLEALLIGIAGEATAGFSVRRASLDAIASPFRVQCSKQGVVSGQFRAEHGESSAGRPASEAIGG